MNRIDCDVLVIGGGAAGCRAAYEAKRTHPQLTVLMAVAGGLGSSGSTTLVASESLGINAPFDYMADGDSPAVFLRDILETGGGLSDPALARIVAQDACRRIEELMALGLNFDKAGETPLQRKLSGCTKARSLTCGGATGREMVKALKGPLLKSGVEVLEQVRILDLLRDAEGRLCGALALQGREPLSIRAQSVVLASGGAGRLFRHHVNPPTLEGDGWSMAYRAGAALVNMEFFQVGPAVFNAPIPFIIHSHMWRLRPRLTNRLGEEFLARYCPPGIDPAEVLDLKAMSYPFSVRTHAKYLDIAIFKEVMAGRGTASGAVYFDVTHVDRRTLLERAPITYEMLLKAGIDLAKQPLEVGLVVQNFNGGIRIDSEGFTGIAGLYAAGEVTGGVHGSDRPGGNNLIDTQVFGYRAGIAAAAAAAGRDRAQSGFPEAERPLAPCAPSPEASAVLREAEDLFYEHLTIVRTRPGLEKVLAFAQGHAGASHPVVASHLQMGSLIGRAALLREESRGTHYREDFPAMDRAWDGKRVLLVRTGEGEEQTRIEPVPA